MAKRVLSGLVIVIFVLALAACPTPTGGGGTPQSDNEIRAYSMLLLFITSANTPDGVDIVDNPDGSVSFYDVEMPPKGHCDSEWYCYTRIPYTHPSGHDVAW